jgi:hypothetical protein
MPEPESPKDRDRDSDHGNEDHFLEQALLALDGLLEVEEQEELKARLGADVDLRRRFVQLCLQSQAMTEALGMISPDVMADPRFDLDPLEPRRPAARGGSDLRRETDGRAKALKRAWRPRWSWFPWSIAAAASLLLLLTNGSRFWKRSAPAPAPVRLQPATVVSTDRERAPQTGRERPIFAEFESLAMLIKLDGALWEPVDGPAPAERDVLAARRLRLRSGRATLAFLSGVTLTLEGPVDVDLVSIDRVFCRQGRLRARVPKGAEGFVIASPGSAVIDMGTEFALNVEADGRSRVMVFEGAAEAALLDTAGSPEQTQLVERSKAFELDPRTHRIEEADPRPEGFVPAPEFALPSLHLDPAYANAVLQSHPRGYWRFESFSGSAVANEVAGGLPLRVNGPVAIAETSPGQGCAVFKANEPAQFLYTDGLWELARTPGHAIEFWFLSEGIAHASLVGLFPPKDYLSLGHRGRHVHTFLVELTARDRQSLYKPASIRFLHRWPLDTRIGNNILSEGVYVPRRWHHVLAQKNGDRLDLFFDGVLDHSMRLEPDHPTLSCRLVVGRRTPDPLELEDIRGFVGRIDELAIYDHPLSADEVRLHFQLATTEDGSH